MNDQIITRRTLNRRTTQIVEDIDAAVTMLSGRIDNISAGSGEVPADVLDRIQVLEDIWAGINVPLSEFEERLDGAR